MAKYINLIRALETAELNTLIEGMSMAKALSSGTYKSEILERPVSAGGFGRPYGIRPGVRLPPPYVNDYFEGLPAKINKQSGTFYSMWKFSEPKFTLDTISSSLYNDAPQAEELVSGTEWAMKRPLPDLVALRLDKKRIKNIVEALLTDGTLGIELRIT